MRQMESESCQARANASIDTSQWFEFYGFGETRRHFSIVPL